MDRIIFMQGGSPQIIPNPVYQLLKKHFENAKIISRYFPTAWTSRSHDLNSCYLWLWGSLYDVVFSTQIAYLAEMKVRIVQHILNVTPETLQAVIQYAISRPQLLPENCGQRIEHFFHPSLKI